MRLWTRLLPVWLYVRLVRRHCSRLNINGSWWAEDRDILVKIKAAPKDPWEMMEADERK